MSQKTSKGTLILPDGKGGFTEPPKPRSNLVGKMPPMPAVPKEVREWGSLVGWLKLKYTAAEVRTIIEAWQGLPEKVREDALAGY